MCPQFLVLDAFRLSTHTHTKKKKKKKKNKTKTKTKKKSKLNDQYNIIFHNANSLLLLLFFLRIISLLFLYGLWSHGRKINI